MMTRNLVLCAVPTVIALLAIYWFTKKKKIKPNTFESSKNGGLEQEVQCDFSTESSSDFGNTLSDASSFASPVSSEKSLRTNSPLYISSLPDMTGNLQKLQTLTNRVDDTSNDDLSFVKKDKNFYEFDVSSDEILEANKSVKEYSSSNLEDHVTDTNSLKCNNIKPSASPSECVVVQKCNESNGLIFTEKNKSVLTREFKTEEMDEAILWNNHVDKNVKEILSKENASVNSKTNSFLSSPKDSEKSIEADGHSSVFDENSLSYVSDDSNGKHLVECKNKGSLSSVLGENSLLSSISGELDSTVDCVSPIEILDKLDSYDSLHFKPGLFSVNGEKVESLNESSHEPSKSFNFCTISEKLNIVGEESFCNGDATLESTSSDVLVISTESSNAENIAEETQVDFSDLKIINATSCSNSNSIQSNLSNLNEFSIKLADLSIGNYTTFKKLASADKHKPLVQSVSSSPELNVNGCYEFNNCNNFIKENENTQVSPVNTTNHDSTEKTHLDAVAGVVQRISTDFNTSLTLLLGNTADQSTNENLVSFTNNNKTKELLCLETVNDTKQNCDKLFEISSSNSCDNTRENKNSNDSKTLEAESSIVPNTTHSNRQPDSYNWDGNKEMKPFNGSLDIKSSSQLSSEFVYEFELPQELVGRLIGKHGRSVKNIMERSNANVFIKRHPYDHLLKVVVVEGQRTDVNEALDIIRRKYPPSMYPTVTLVQTNVVASTGVPMPESLQLHLPEGASCDVILSSLVSAGHFFLQQPTHPTYPSLSTLDQCMIGLYSQVDTPILPQPIEAGVICAAPVFRGWYRAQVVYVCENATDCGIKFVDYGGFSRVPISSLRQIRSDFMSLPFQASECYLAGVRPVGDSWSPEATSTFEELAQGQILQAVLVEYADDGIPCVNLFRVQGISSTFINKELAERGLAVWVNNHWDPH